MVAWNLREMGPGSGEGGIFLRVCEDPKGHNHFPWYRTDFCFIYVETQGSISVNDASLSFVNGAHHADTYCCERGKALIGGSPTRH